MILLHSEGEMAKAEGYIFCPICGKRVALSLHGIVQRHLNDQKDGRVCQASSNYYDNVVAAISR